MVNASIAIPLERVAATDQRLSHSMQSLMTHVLRKAGQAPRPQFMIVGADRGVGCSFVASQLAVELGHVLPSLLVVEVADQAPAYAIDAQVLRTVENDTPVSLRMSTGTCLELFTRSNAESSNIQQIRAGLERFQVVLWDLPPPTHGSVALAMTLQAPEFILVAQADRTRRHQAQQVSAQIQRSGGRLLGVVLNRWTDPIPRWAQRWL